MKITVSRIALLFALAAMPSLAQTQNPPANPSTTGQPADSANPPPPLAEKPALKDKAPDNKKPKKVWTNEDMRSNMGGVSVVGEASSAQGTAPDQQTNAPGNRARRKLIETYRAQILQIQAQIEAADKRIAQLKDFKGENSSPSGGINPNHGYNMVPVEDQVKQLEDKKKQLQAKIDDVESEARKNGIEPGELR